MSDDLGDVGVDREQAMETTGRMEPEHADDVDPQGDAEAGGLIRAIQRARTASDVDVDDLWTSDGMMLPGFGSPRDSCGDDFPRFCTDCGKHTIWRRTCYQSMCPECGKSWARRTSKRVCAKLEAMRRYRSSILDDHQRFHHTVVSPPADWEPAAENSWERAKDVVKDLLEAAGLWGYVVYHPFKGKNGDDRGAWKNRVLQGRDWSDVKDELKFAPHFHVIAVGHEVPGGSTTRALESETGWVLHRITKEGTNVSIYDEYDLARAVTYCLSHAGIDVSGGEDEDDEAATRWTGGKINPRSKTANDVTADDELENWMDGVVRSVAPKTLDLDYNGLACSDKVLEDDLGDQEDKVDVAAAEASMARGKAYAPGAGAAASSGGDATGHGDSDPMERSAGDLPDAPGENAGTGDVGSVDQEDYIDDVVEAASKEIELEPCSGRLVGLGKAPAFLDDQEWRDSARYVDELEETYEEWSDRLEWLGRG